MLNLLDLLKKSSDSTQIQGNKLQKKHKKTQAQQQNQKQSREANQKKQIMNKNKLMRSSLNQQKKFKNSIILKQELLVSKFYQVISGADQKFVPQIKIQPIILFNKLQQPKPYIKSNVIYKQLAFDISLQSQICKPYKIKDCVSPARPNSQVFKRLSKNFYQNIKNGVDQCILFTGLENKSRLHSSIGNQNNPGIFMISAIAILDQKYKQNHQRFDAEFSFLQYKNEKVYDLINYTQIPLQAKQKLSIGNQNFSSLQFCEHKVKVCTFMQFIKLFKVALFNNKERDFKTYKNGSYGKSGQGYFSQKLTSTFIMKILVKKYNIDNDLIFEQQNLLVDLEQNSSIYRSKKDGQLCQQSQRKRLKHTFNKESQKQTIQSTTRSIMDYLLIEINNSNPTNKFIHYHMVEKNLLIQMLKRYLRVKVNSPFPSSKHISNPNNKLQSTMKQEVKQNFVGGQIFIINSFTTNCLSYQQNIRYYESILSSLGYQWEANYYRKSKFNKYFDINYSAKIFQKTIYAMKNRKYNSLRDLNTGKQFYIKQCKKIISSINQYKAIIVEYTKMKRDLKYSQNVLTAYQLQLIGNCIKSDNYKDFYVSKGFLSLPRQIQIKTSNTKNDILNFIQGLKQIQQKYEQIKMKQFSQRKFSTKPPQCLFRCQESSQNSKQSNKLNKLNDFRLLNKKFKLIENLESSQNKFEQFNDLEEFSMLKKYIIQYLTQVWHKICLYEQRTLTQDIIYEDFFVEEVNSLKSLFENFIKDVQEISEQNIKCTKNQNLLQLKHLTQLMRSINEVKKSILKYEPTKSGKSPFWTNKKDFQLHTKQNIYRTTSYLPKIQQNNQSLVNKQKSTSNSDKKYLNKKLQVFQINGKINFQSLMINPKRC